ncbi:super-infection exclusion protein B [Providencia rettgeri]
MDNKFFLGVFLNFFRNVTLPQVLFSFMGWIALEYKGLNPFDQDKLSWLPFIPNEYKSQFCLFVLSFCVFFFLFNIPFKKTKNYILMKSYLTKLDSNEKIILKDFIEKNLNSDSFSYRDDSGLQSLVDKGVLKPLNPDDYKFQRNPYQDYSINERARKLLKKIYSPQ